MKQLDEIARRIDGLCAGYEKQLRDEGRGEFHDLLSEVDEQHREELFRNLLLLKWDYLSRPNSVSDEIRNYAENADWIRDCFDRTRVLSPQPLRDGDCVGHYQIRKCIGEGVYGKVFEAWDNRLDRLVAIKSPRLEQGSTLSVAEDFLREATSLARLNHNHIVRIYDVLLDDGGWPLLVLEHVSGSRFDVSDDRAMNIGYLSDVSRAISYIHQKGFVHRDLKPDNLMVDDGGRIVVADFGLSLSADRQGEQRGISAGTIRYMSPELVRGESHWIDGRSDIWSLGVILYEVLTGTVPFADSEIDSTIASILESPVKPPRQANPECPPALESICLRCLMKNPDDRYSTADDFGRALRRYQAKSSRKVNFSWMAIAGFSFVAIVGLMIAMVVSFSSLAKESSGPAGANMQASTRSLNSISEPSSVTFSVTREPEENLSVLQLPDAVPLRDGDQMQISIEFDRPLYLSVHWLDPDGELTTLCPQHKDLSASANDRRTQFHLPSLTMTEPQEGMATLVMLAAEQPFEFDAQDFLANWSPQTKPTSRELVTDFGNVVKSHFRGSVRFDEASEQPLMKNQRRFHKPPFSSLVFCRAICIPISGLKRAE